MKKIKKVLMPLMTIVLAIALAVSTSAFKFKKSFATVTMYYQGSSFTQANVQNKSNWSLTTQACTSGNVSACKVTVPSDIVSSGAFISTVSLNASATNPAILLDVKNSGSSVGPAIQNRDN